MNIEFLEQVLQQLHDASDEVKASAIVSKDGIMLASLLPDDVNEDKAAAMSAAVLSLGDRMVNDLMHGVTDRVMVQSNGGYVIVTAVSDELLLTIVAVADAKLGMLFHDIKQVAKKVETMQFAAA